MENVVLVLTDASTVVMFVRAGLALFQSYVTRKTTTATAKLMKVPKEIWISYSPSTTLDR